MLPNIRLHPDVAVRTGGEIAWAFRKNSPQLARPSTSSRGATARARSSATRSSRSTCTTRKYVKNATTQEEYAKLLRTIQIFQKYGDAVRLRLADARRAGLPGVAPRPEREEPRRRGRRDAGDAGDRQGDWTSATSARSSRTSTPATKYLRCVIDRYFADAELDGLNRQLFAFASYNAGPAQIAKLRKEAEAQGLDPNVWFNNVELVAAERIGQETVRYVAQHLQVLRRLQTRGRRAGRARARAARTRQPLSVGRLRAEARPEPLRGDLRLRHGVSYDAPIRMASRPDRDTRGAKP